VSARNTSTPAVACAWKTLDRRGGVATPRQDDPGYVGDLDHADTARRDRQRRQQSSEREDAEHLRPRHLVVRDADEPKRQKPVFFFDGGTSGEASKASTTTSVMPRTETVATSRPCLRVSSAFHAGVPSCPILQREGRLSPTMRAGACLIRRRKLVCLTLQTLGRGPDEPFPFRQALRSLHVPSSPRGGACGRARLRWR